MPTAVEPPISLAKLGAKAIVILVSYQHFLVYSILEPEPLFFSFSLTFSFLTYSPSNACLDLLLIHTIA